jgi:chromate transporter
MAASAKITWGTAIIPIAGALLIWLGGLSPVWIILVTALATLGYTYLRERRNT